MEPFAVVDDAVEPPGFDGPVIENIQGKSLVRRTLEQPWVQHLDAGVQPWRDFTFLTPGHDAVPEGGAEIAQAGLALGLTGGMQQQQAVHGVIVPGVGDALERIIGTV